MLDNLPYLALGSVMLFYIAFRILWKLEQRKMKYNNFEWWTYRQLADLYKYYGYPEPEQTAKKTNDYIIESIKAWKEI